MADGKTAFVLLGRALAAEALPDELTEEVEAFLLDVAPEYLPPHDELRAEWDEWMTTEGTR